VSGSCSLRTCWNQLSSFRETGDRLRDRYDGATYVTFNRQGTRLVQRNRKFNRPTREDLVFIDQSHDFCDADQQAGLTGTRGRACDRTSQGMDGCELMCCGRGFKTSKRRVTERCRCKFHWCCRVECELCEKNVDLYTCK
jgi:wingless-type MMTV integration site family protein 5